MKAVTIITMFLAVLATTPCLFAEVPTKWKRFNTFDANATSYAIWYYSESNTGAYGDAQTIFTDIVKSCGNVTFPGSHDTPVYWGHLQRPEQRRHVVLRSRGPGGRGSGVRVRVLPAGDRQRGVGGVRRFGRNVGDDPFDRCVRVCQVRLIFYYPSVSCKKI